MQEGDKPAYSKGQTVYFRDLDHGGAWKKAIIGDVTKAPGGPFSYWLGVEGEARALLLPEAELTAER